MTQSQPGDALSRPERLEAVAALDVSADAMRALEDLLVEVSDDLDLPIAVVSVVMGEAQQFLASRGLGGWLAAVDGTPSEWSFCANVVRDEAPFVV